MIQKNRTPVHRLPPDTPKDAAFRAVGRTVVNFQRLEHNLKLAAQLGQVQGTLQKVQRDSEKRKERAQSLTLGQAIQAWLTYLDGGSVPPTWTPDLFDVSVCIAVVLEPGTESPETHAQELKSLLETRNSLIHTRLATFPWESPESCARLVAELDSINTRVGEQVNYMAKLLGEIQRLHQESAEEAIAAIDAEFAKRAAGKTTGSPTRNPT